MEGKKITLTALIAFGLFMVYLIVQGCSFFGVNPNEPIPEDTHKTIVYNGYVTIGGVGDAYSVGYPAFEILCLSGTVPASVCAAAELGNKAFVVTYHDSVDSLALFHNTKDASAYNQLQTQAVRVVATMAKLTAIIVPWLNTEDTNKMSSQFGVGEPLVAAVPEITLQQIRALHNKVPQL